MDLFPTFSAPHVLDAINLLHREADYYDFCEDDKQAEQYTKKAWALLPLLYAVIEDDCPFLKNYVWPLEHEKADYYEEQASLANYGADFVDDPAAYGAIRR